MQGVMKYKRRMRHLLLSVIALALAACVSEHKITCAQRDWFELGRRDGLQGAPKDRLSLYRQECKGEVGANAETVYLNGRNAGLVEYCAVDNGFELGRMGLNYLYVCPAMMEPDFLNAYQRGQRTRVLQIKRKELDAQIESLTDQLLRTHDGTADSQHLREELSQLKEARTETERDLNRVTR